MVNPFPHFLLSVRDQLQVDIPCSGLWNYLPAPIWWAVASPLLSWSFGDGLFHWAWPSGCSKSPLRRSFWQVKLGYLETPTPLPEPRGHAYYTLGDGSSIEVFQLGPDASYNPDGEWGWYWWACFPGCLPDGDFTGPFNTPAEALADARKELE